MKSNSVIVIGSGIAGIASCIRLACKGYDVTVFEKNSYPGGKLTEFTQSGFRFDAGPSLFTLPKQVDELFELAGENPRDHFNYDQLPVVCHYFWDDGTFLEASGNKIEFAKEVERVLHVPANRVTNYLKKAQFIYETSAPVFLHRSLHKWRNFLNSETMKGILASPRLGIFSKLHQQNVLQLGDPKLVQLFNRYATYNGSDPYQAPAVLQSISHLEFGKGAWFPKGGMSSITNSLVALAKRKGVKFLFNEEVDEIMTKGKRVVGVKTNKNQYAANWVVCNSDVVPTYRKLLVKHPAPEKILRQPRSSSALIFYWGINDVFTELNMHNIFFSNDYQEEFSFIFEGNKISNDPTIYVNITSQIQKEDAPEGCQNWFVMINVPGNKGQDWDALIEQARKDILQKLSLRLGRNIEALILNESVLDPRSIESKTSSFQGSLYGSSSNNRYAAFLRHANFSSHITNLYFCGGSVHPGGGIPLCLQSARIVADLIPNA
jgi:phytoene desaturase